MARPPITHRREEMHELMAGILPGLRKVFGAGDGHSVFAVTSSGTGGMEAAVTGALPRGAKILNLICGHFGERWHALTKVLGREAYALRVDWGKGVSAAEVERALQERPYDAVTLTHNETSTGALNPLEEIASAVRRFEGVLFFVDAVSSLGGVPVDVERNGIDICFAGTQKCLGLPAGLTVASVSERCLQFARRNPDRGYYFDLTRYASAAAASEPAFTPSTSHLFALGRQLEYIEGETLAARYDRHRAMMERVVSWVEGPEMRGRGFSLLAEATVRSPTVTTIGVPDGFDVEGFLTAVRNRGYVLGTGVDRWYEKSFRIGHMGDLTVEDISGLINVLSDCLR
jgi:aspartate aminotransferase-like enzyme